MIVEPAVYGIYTNCSDEFQHGPLKDLSRCLKANNHDAGVIIYDDYNSKVSNDQQSIGTITCEAGNSALRHNYKIIEPTVKIKQATSQGYAECKVGGVADLSFPNSTTRRGRVQDNGDTSPTLMTTENGIYKIESPYRIRKLTPKECWRLMGFSDLDFFSAMMQDHKAAINLMEKYKDNLNGIEIMREAETMQKTSNTQLYKQAGNSIVVPVLEAIFRQLF